MSTQRYFPAGEEHLPPYRCGVGIVVFSDKGQVLGCVRHKEKSVHFTTDYSDNALQWPQGGIDEGEDEAETAYRELFEEVGLKRDQVKLLQRAPEYTFYDFPDSVQNSWKPGSKALKYRGQRHAWFAFLLTDNAHTFSFDHHHEVEFEAVEWTTLDDVAGRVIEFKRNAYGKAAAMFRTLEQDLRRKA